MPENKSDMSLSWLLMLLIAGVWQCHCHSMERVEEVQLRLFSNGSIDLEGDEYSKCFDKKKKICEICAFKLKDNIDGYIDIKFLKESKKMDVKMKVLNKVIFEKLIEINKRIIDYIELLVPKMDIINATKYEKIIEDFKIEFEKIEIEEKKFCIKTLLKLRDSEGKEIDKRYPTHSMRPRCFFL